MERCRKVRCHFIPIDNTKNRVSGSHCQLALDTGDFMPVDLNIRKLDGFKADLCYTHKKPEKVQKTGRNKEWKIFTYDP